MHVDPLRSALATIALLLAATTVLAEPPSASKAVENKPSQGGFLPADPTVAYVNCDVTEFGATLPRPTKEKPVYYKLSSAGLQDLGIPIAGEKNPTEHEITQVVVQILGKQGYLPATETNNQKPSLLIMFFWGTINHDIASDAALNGVEWDARRNALAFLGAKKYDIDTATNDLLSPSPGTLTYSAEQENLVNVVFDHLHVIALGAYDYNSVLEKKRKLVWSAKIASPARGYWLKDQLPVMMALAGPMLGRDTPKPVAVSIADRSKVGMGELRTVEIIEDKPAPKTK